MSQRPNLSLITFVRTDYKEDYIEQAVKEFSIHFRTKREYLKDFFRLIVISKRWTKATLDNDIKSWTERFSHIYKGKSSKITALVSNWFNQCKDDKAINDLRGAIVEAFVLAYIDKNFKTNPENFGWGAKVIITESDDRKRDVIYRCTESPKPYPSCHDRSTVDVGFWDGRHGRFYECKVQPATIQCKEIKYMSELDTQLSRLGVSYELFFVFLETRDSIEMRLADYKVKDFFFKLVGSNELKDMLSA